MFSNAAFPVTIVTDSRLLISFLLARGCTNYLILFIFYGELGRGHHGALVQIGARTVTCTTKGPMIHVQITTFSHMLRDTCEKLLGCGFGLFPDVTEVGAAVV